MQQRAKLHRRKHNKIHSLQSVGGEWISSAEDVQKSFMDFYGSLFRSSMSHRTPVKTAIIDRDTISPNWIATSLWRILRKLWTLSQSIKVLALMASIACSSRLLGILWKLTFTQLFVISSGLAKCSRRSMSPPSPWCQRWVFHLLLGILGLLHAALWCINAFQSSFVLNWTQFSLT